MSDALPPGSTIGILGGGQLGRMLAMAAARLGYRTHVYAPAGECVASEVAGATTRSAWNDAAALAGFVASCDIVTFEFENVPVEPLAPHAAAIRPHPRALDVAQDRLNEKRFVERLGGRTAAYRAVDTAADLDAAIAALGTPGILKTRRQGYDGKGQQMIADARSAEAMRAPVQPSIYEGMVRFEAEFSVILVRGADGTVRFWDSPDNAHEAGILVRSSLPAPDPIACHVERARALTRSIAEALDYVGVLTCEFFACTDGPVFNEMAPRVHNSGHWTIEGAVTSQFENHVRAIVGLPLGDPALAGRTVTMENLIGNADHAALGDPAAHLHLYGKRDARPGRKMGHVTRVSPC